MDLRKFYLDNVSEQEYYYTFHDLVENVNCEYSFLDNFEETENYQFLIDDINDAIEKFKYLCQPENEIHSTEDKCWFYLILFYLKKGGYVIKEFPRLVEHPPKETYDFVNKEVRNRLIAEGKDDNGTVRYAARRTFIAQLTFVQKENYVELEEVIEKKFKKISNRQANFQEMSTEEKLAEIANLIEHMLKKDGKFLSLDYDKISFDFIDEEAIKKYRKKIQCFRHSSRDSISERESFTKEQKNFLIDYGLTIIKVIYVLLAKE